MKKNFSSILFFFIIFLSSNSINAENLIIAFVDVEKIVATSNAGKKINKTLDGLIKKKNKVFEKKEKSLKAKEEEIIKQKNILSKEEIDKKIVSLQDEAKKYRLERSNFKKSINEKKLKSTNQLLIYLNKTISKYASENSISLVLQKRNIIIGKINMDITDQILTIFNKDVKDVKLN